MATNFNDTLLPPPGYVEYQNEFFFALPFFMHFVLFFIMVASALLDVYFLIILLGRKQLRAHKENIIFSGNILFDLFHHINGASVHFNVFWPIVTHVKCKNFRWYRGINLTSSEFGRRLCFFARSERENCRNSGYQNREKLRTQLRP